MAADDNSKIAWHRAQVAKHREALKHLERARFAHGEITGAESKRDTQNAVAELNRKVRDSLAVIAAHEKQTRRPLTTDFQTLASAPWSNWNDRVPAKPR